MSQTLSVTVDNTDPSVIYSPPVCDECLWRRVNDSNGISTAANGPNANVTFSFAGTGISVYGALEPFDTISSWVYLIDGNSSTLKHFTSPAPNHELNNILFYQSPPLPDANHTLFINRVSGGIVLDKFVYTPSASSAPTTSKRHTQPAIVAAGALGGLVLLAAVAFAFFYVRRKHQGSRNIRIVDLENDSPSRLSTETAVSFPAVQEISPFPLSFPPTTTWAIDTKRAPPPTTEYPPHESAGEIMLPTRELPMEEDMGALQRPPGSISNVSHFSEPPPSYTTD